MIGTIWKLLELAQTFWTERTSWDRFLAATMTWACIFEHSADQLRKAFCKLWLRYILTTHRRPLLAVRPEPSLARGVHILLREGVCRDMLTPTVSCTQFHTMNFTQWGKQTCNSTQLWLSRSRCTIFTAPNLSFFYPPKTKQKQTKTPTLYFIYTGVLYS